MAAVSIFICLLFSSFCPSYGEPFTNYEHSFLKGFAPGRSKRDSNSQPAAQSFWFGELQGSLGHSKDDAEKAQDLLKVFDKKLTQLEREVHYVNLKEFEYTHDHGRGCCMNQISNEAQRTIDSYYFSPIYRLFLQDFCGFILADESILDHERKPVSVVFPADYYCLGRMEDPEDEEREVIVRFCEETFYSNSSESCKKVSEDAKKQVSAILKSSEYKTDPKGYCFHLVGDENLPEHVHESIPNLKARIPSNYYCVGGHGNAHHQALEVMHHYCFDVFFHGKKNCSISFEAEKLLLDLFDTDLFKKNILNACDSVLPKSFLEDHKPNYQKDLTFEIDNYCPLKHTDPTTESREILSQYCQEKIYSV